MPHPVLIGRAASNPRPAPRAPRPAPRAPRPAPRAPRPAPRARPTQPAPCAPAAAKPRGGRHLVGVLGGGALSTRLLDAALLSAATAVRRARAAQRRAHPRARRGGVSLDSRPRGAPLSSQRTPVHRMC